MYLLRRVFGTDGRNGQNVGMERSKLLRRFGKRGKGKGQFNMPSGVAVTKSGECFVDYCYWLTGKYIDQDLLCTSVG